MKLFCHILLIGLAVLQPGLTMVDNNGNGMSDVWERLYDVVGADPLADNDGDGQNNLAESLAGTDPNDGNSVLEITNVAQRHDGLLIGWESRQGLKYQIKSSETLNPAQWIAEGSIIAGNGGMMYKGFNKPAAAQRFYRVGVVDGHSELVSQALQTMTHDTDGDGQSDIAEIAAGLNPFDAQSKIKAPTIIFGGSTDLRWNTKAGKRYQVQQRPTTTNGAWQNVGAPHVGTGTEVTATIPHSADSENEYRVSVFDVDSDGDGLTDWEELQVGLNPKAAKTDPLGTGDFDVLNAQLAAVSVVSVKAANAVANLTRMENGGFELTRTGGLDALQVTYIVSGTALAGSDYASLSGTVTIPFGENSVVIPVEPLASSSIDLSESVIITLQDLSTYDLGPQDSQQINVIKEVALNVTDYGATGDGLTDDTLAIQAAINALEASSTHNTLYFPSGKYRLNTTTMDNHYGRPKLRILTLGGSDMAGRDIIVYGAEGATLYSTVSPTRADMLVARASFRSLHFYDLKWEKDSVPLSPLPSTEPNDADGVSLVYHDGRYVEHVKFSKCQFFNCHGALHTYLGGYDHRGKMKQLGFYDCAILNPYGANTVNSQYSWGGGQQCKISAWVGRAVYLRNRFEGGGEDMTDTTTCPGGHVKDGCHFGSPLSLVFKNNTVLRMGVEAVLQDSINNGLGNTSSSFAIPPPDSSTEVSVTVTGSSQFIPGNVVSIRTIGTPSVPSSNNVFDVAGYDALTRELRLVNTGYQGNAEAGTIIPSERSIFLQDYNPTTALIQGNLIDGRMPPGGVAFDAGSGIVCIAKGDIRNNCIIGYWSGINLYEDTKRPLWHSSRGTRIFSNVIVTRNSLNHPNTFENGILLRGGDEDVRGNYVLTPVSYQFGGIVARDSDSLLEGNYVAAMESVNNGYWSPKRSVGIAAARSSSHVMMKGNYTYGLDVGAGPQVWDQDPPHYVIEHHSYNDYTAVDPVGLLPND